MIKPVAGAASEALCGVKISASVNPRSACFLKSGERRKAHSQQAAYDVWFNSRLQQKLLEITLTPRKADVEPEFISTLRRDQNRNSRSHFLDCLLSRLSSNIHHPPFAPRPFSSPSLGSGSRRRTKRKHPSLPVCPNNASQAACGPLSPALRGVASSKPPSDRCDAQIAATKPNGEDVSPLCFRPRLAHVTAVRFYLKDGGRGHMAGANVTEDHEKNHRPAPPPPPPSSERPDLRLIEELLSVKSRIILALSCNSSI